MAKIEKYVHYFWYVMVLVSITSSFFNWELAVSAGVNSPWFSLFCVAMAQLSRLRSGAKETVLDRAFTSKKVEIFAIGSVVAVMLGIGLWFAYLVYIQGPATKREGIQSYLDARAKKLELERNSK